MSDVKIVRLQTGEDVISKVSKDTMKIACFIRTQAPDLADCQTLIQQLKANFLW